jgi:hypothetical protein
MLGFSPISSEPISTILFILITNVSYNYKLPLEVRVAENTGVKTLDWVMTLRETVWEIKC